jgi:hypothetical protein
MIDWSPEGSPQSRQSVVAKKIKCEVERYTVHKHFYGNGGAKFPQNAYQKGKRSGFRALVSVSVSTGQLRHLHFDDA